MTKQRKTYFIVNTDAVESEIKRYTTLAESMDSRGNEREAARFIGKLSVLDQIAIEAKRVKDDGTGKNFTLIDLDGLEE